MKVKKGHLRCLLVLMLLPGWATAYLMGQGYTYTPVVNPVISSGHVMARAQVIGPNGGPILVKVRSSGAGGQSSTVEVEEIGEAYAGGPLDGVYVLSGAAYRDVLRQLAQLRARYPERMARAEFIPAAQLASGLPLAGGSSSPGVTLPDHIKTVVVWGRQDRLSPETDTHILLTAPFQLDAGTALAEDVSSLLMNPDGSIRSLAHGSGVGGDSFDVESFTWRTAFYAQPGSTEQSDQRVDRNQDTIFGPIYTAVLEQVGWFGTMYTVTDAAGYYFMNSPMLCMRNSDGGYLLGGMDTNLILTVPTVPFNPNRLGIPPYFEMRDVYAACSDSFYPYRIDFLVDVLWLVGELHLSNTPGGAAIPVGSSVSYEGQDRSGEPTVRVWDYDGDGEPDKAILANKITVTDPLTQQEYVVPEQANDGGWQAVYFSSGTRRPDADALADRVPDLWRLADRTLDGRPTGLLTEISEDALRHTDVYIFRESTGELLVEVSGLPEGPYAGRASRIENNAYLWHTLLRGRESVRNNFVAYGTSSGSRSPINEDAFRERSAELGFSSRYQSRDADMPAPGEMLHVVAINRVTGYTGSVRFELGAANSPGGAQQRVPRLELLPPNVRVWAQRLTEIEAGLTAGEQREYLISHEGAHTANDLIVGLYTDWRAADGSPLPNALGQVRGADFGLTGRLAKVRDGQLVPVTAGQALDSSITLEDALAAGSQGAVAEFPIGPGQNLQLLRLPNAESGGNEHYYVNLFGRALNKEVCSHCQYDQAGLHPTLAGRPNHFAPVFVPRFDRGRTDAERQAARAWAKENNESVPDTPAHHQWVLRPEYQFSQLDFSVDEITASYVDDEGNLRSRNLLEDPAPVVTRPDELMDIFYGLVLPLEEMLPGYDGQRQYVIAVGDEEFLIDPDSLDPVRYEDIDRLARVLNSGTPGDYLTVRLFLQHDPENLLWEWAFSSEIIDGIEVTQTIQEYIPFRAMRGFSGRLGEGQKTVTFPVDIVAESPAVIRIYTNSVVGSSHVEWSARINGNSFQGSQGVVVGCSPRDQRVSQLSSHGCKSIDIEFMPLKGVNNVEVHVQRYGESPGLTNRWKIEESREFNFLSRGIRDLTMIVFKICIRDGGFYYCNNDYMDEALVQIGIMSRMLPVSMDRINVVVSSYPIEVPAIRTRSDLAEWQRVMNESVRRYEKSSEVVRGIAVVPHEYLPGNGLASGFSGGGFYVKSHSVLKNYATAYHELAHTLGRQHVRRGGIPECRDTAFLEDQWPYETPHLHSLDPGKSKAPFEVGFDINDKAAKPSPNYYEVMAYCPNRWVSPFTHNSIMDAWFWEHEL